VPVNLLSFAPWPLRHQHQARLALSIFMTILAGVLTLSASASAQGMHHPFAVGANEGAMGTTTGLAGWLLSQESRFYQLLTGAIRAAKQNSMAASGLIGLSFAYGVFHAAGPGHGKAVIASYMLANEKALHRGLIVALGAAILQGLTAIAIVGVAAVILRATAQTMTEAAHLIETASYAGIMLLGASLVFGKGSALIQAWRLLPKRHSQELEHCPAKRETDAQRKMRPNEDLEIFSDQPQSEKAVADLAFGAPQNGYRSEFSKKSLIFADDGRGDHVHRLGCGHFHGLGVETLGAGFAWKTALLTMAAAGARPCSGAILVLVFALSQMIFAAGLASVLAMSLGTALTTGALACFAVYAKQAAAKWLERKSRSSLMIGQIFEMAMAVAVLILGSSLFFAALAGPFGRG
jgi:nickel/cobalt exporter